MEVFEHSDLSLLFIEGINHGFTGVRVFNVITDHFMSGTSHLFERHPTITEAVAQTILLVWLGSKNNGKLGNRTKRDKAISAQSHLNFDHTLGHSEHMSIKGINVWVEVTKNPADWSYIVVQVYWWFYQSIQHIWVNFALSLDFHLSVEVLDKEIGQNADDSYAYDFFNLPAIVNRDILGLLMGPGGPKLVSDKFCLSLEDADTENCCPNIQPTS